MEGLFQLIIDLMKDAESIKKLSGEEKKNRVLLQLREELEKQYDGIALESQMFLLEIVIDGLIDIANKEFSLKKLGKRSCNKCIAFKK